MAHHFSPARQINRDRLHSLKKEQYRLAKKVQLVPKMLAEARFDHVEIQSQILISCIQRMILCPLKKAVFFKHLDPDDKGLYKVLMTWAKWAIEVLKSKILLALEATKCENLRVNHKMAKNSRKKKVAGKFRIV